MVRRPAGGARFVHAGAARHDLRLPRPQRLRQDDDHPHAVRAAHARRRTGHLSGLRPAHADRGDQAARRLHDPALQLVRGSFRAGEPRVRGAALWARQRARRGARHDRAARAAGPYRATGRHPVGRLEAAACARRLHPAEPATAPARRADCPPRSQGAARVLERNSRARRRRAPGAGLDPLHGRSRALSRDRLHRHRRAARARHGRRGGRQLRAHDLPGERRKSCALGGRTGACARRRHGRAVRHQPARLRPRPRRARGHDRALAQRPGARLDRVPPHARRRVHRADESQQGHPAMSIGPSAASTRRRGGFWRRVGAMLLKEFLQLRRDRITFATMIVLPLLQLVLFGYAINTTPRNLPTAVLLQEQSDVGRSILAAMRNTKYFAVVREVHSVAELDHLLTAGEVLFAVEIPATFEPPLRRRDRPALLVAADATDPVASGTALGALSQVVQTALQHDYAIPDAVAPAFEIRTHARYNPGAVTQLNIVPGLLGTILTMTMLIFTAL